MTEPVAIEMGEQMQAKSVKKKRLAQLMRKQGWGYRGRTNGVSRRLYALAAAYHPWWDWGHWLMILTGTDFGGNWQEPEPPTWWYRLGTPKPMRRTKYPTHPLSTIEVIKDYDTFRRRTEGLNEDQMYEWKAINVSEGELQLGHRYWGKNFYGMPKCEVALLRRYLRMWNRLDWFGLRSWLYSQALHAAVYRKKPGSCGVEPPKGQGGYNHWLCTLPKRHEGRHRFNNYTWGDVGGVPIGVLHDPVNR